MKSTACFAASAGDGAFATSLSVMPCIWWPRIGCDGFTNVDQRSVILPPLTLTTPISRRSDSFGSVPVVSTSTIANSRLASTAATKSRTEPVPGSSDGVSFGLPTASRSCSWMSMSGWRARWPNRMASAMTSSGRSLAPASTIMIASRVPETIRSSSDSSTWLKVGLTTNSPSIRPIRTAPTGPANGISLIDSAADAATVPRTSGSFSWSVERTVMTSWMSSL